MGRTTSSAALAALLLAVGGCGGGGGEQVKGPPPAAPSRIALTSPAFPAGGPIPRRFTCSGAGAAPPLAWRGVPPGARALALTVEDPGAQSGTFVHWILFDVPSSARSLAGATPPAGARQARNSAGKSGWTAPCPPAGDPPHRYVFTLYALRAPITLPDGADPGAVRAAIAKIALARGQLVGSARSG